MFKCNSYNPKKILSACFVLLMSLSIHSCSNKYEQELLHLEDLTEKLEANKKNFDLDIPLFESRIAYIKSTMRFFRNDYQDSISLELGNNLSRYKGISKIYVKKTGEFKSNLKDQQELEVQLRNLKTDLLNGNLSKEEFKNYYNTEKADIDKLINSSFSVKKNLYEVEPEYSRITKALNPLME